jgi:Holliday junction resolvase
MRRAARTDNTQAEIVDVLRAHGCRVLRSQSPEPGHPDLIVLKPVYQEFDVELVECKARRGKLRTAQQRLRDEGWPIVVLRSADEAMAWLRGG